MSSCGLRRRALLSGTMLMAAVVGYGRRAYAACVNVGGSTYQCSGAETSTQTISANNAAVSTLAGFSVDNTTAGNAITITGDGALSYIDTNASPLTAPGNALYVLSNGDYAGTPGSIAIDTNGALSGGTTGIYAVSFGTGALTVTANGDVTGTSRYGIRARNFGTALSVTTGAGTTVSGYYLGIDARNKGTGALTVTANGDATGTGRAGIYAYNYASGTALNLTTGAGTTASGARGINARNRGGALTVTVNGDVSGTSFEGILAYNSASGTALNLTTGAGTTVSGNTRGIYALNFGTGALTITANGNATGATGIDARNKGTGALTVTANGDVTGTSGDAIYANNFTSGTDLRVTTGVGSTISGSTTGIDARNKGTGALTVTANGDVTGTSGYGIYATNSASGTDLRVTTGAGTALSGGTTGIYAVNFGTGALTVTANGDVTGTSRYGIRARNFGTALSVTTGAGTTVSGYYLGIDARNKGTGALTVTANGDATGTGRAGIYAYNYASGTALNLTTGAGTTASGARGINARNRGGALTVTVNGDVSGTSFEGILAYNSASGTALNLTTGAGTTVSGNTRGIYALNFGTGALTITANGNVTGATGIDARNKGTGALTVTANGDVTGTSDRAILAYNSASGTDLRVTTGVGTALSGRYFGIAANNLGTGALTIAADGAVTATTGVGIAAGNSGTDLSVTTGAGTTVSGGDYGIRAINHGTGALTVTAGGDVTGGTGRYGIHALNFGTALSVTTGAGTTVSGGSIGIDARNNGTGALTITTNGDVTGTSGEGIYARSSGGPIGITVAGTSTVTSNGTTVDDFAIETRGGPAAVTVAGTLNGGAGGAVLFDQTAAFANRLELQTGAVINGNVLGGPGTDTLALSGTGSGSFNVGQLAAFEAGEKTDTGAWTLTGSNTGITTFSVGGGALFVNGSLSNAAFAVTGGALAGTGTVGSVIVNDGGTFAPGSGAPGTSMQVAGNAVFQSGATYKVFLNSASASLATVGGTATLAGTVNATFVPGGDLQKQQYTILTAAGGLGGTTFANTSSPNFIAALSYDADDVFLNLTAALGAGTALTANQQNVATPIDAFFNDGGTLPPGFGALFGLTGNALGNALSQLSGEAGASTTQGAFDATNQFMSLLLDPFNDGHLGTDGGDGGALGYADAPTPSHPSPASGGGLGWGKSQAYAAVTPKDRLPVKAVPFAARWSVWASGYGGSSKVSGDAATGSHDTTSRIYGMAAGADYRLSPDTLLGFALGGAGFNFGLSDGLGGGHADLFQAGLYGRHRFGNAYVSGALAYGWQDVTTDRTVTISGTDKLEAEFHPQTFAARLEGGYRFATPWLGVTPYGALQVTSFDLPSYAEHATSGSDQFALSYDSETTTNWRTELGARFDKSFLLTDGLLTLRSRIAWAHDSNTDRPVSATFQTLPGASFTVNGARPAADGALVSAGAQMRWRNGVSLAGSFEGEFSGTTQSYAGKGTLRYVFN